MKTRGFTCSVGRDDDDEKREEEEIEHDIIRRAKRGEREFWISWSEPQSQSVGVWRAIGGSHKGRLENSIIDRPSPSATGHHHFLLSGGREGPLFVLHSISLVLRLENKEGQFESMKTTDHPGWDRGGRE